MSIGAEKNEKGVEPHKPRLDSPRIGVDEWVAQVQERRQRRTGLWGRVVNGWEAIPLRARYGLILLILLTAPWWTGQPWLLKLLGVTDNAFVVSTLTRFLLFAMLAIGLNVVVGYAGLLDLGYIAFFGIAGYGYAYLASDFVTLGGVLPNGIHLPTMLNLPLIVALTALIGWFIGTVSLRLVGDYLAIVTLGFGQVFLQLVLTATRVELPWVAKPVDLTRGPNGINDVDNLSFFGFTINTTTEYFYLFCLLLVLLYIAVDHINRSRIGRAWRAMREDDLAAEVMGMPTRRLKLLAFALGAGIAALAGVVDAAWQGTVVPNPRYSVLTLVNLYAMIVLGGVGSLPGAVLGAFIFTTVPEALRSVQLASWLFYGGGILGLLVGVRPFRRVALLLGSVIVGGLLVDQLVAVVAPGLDSAVLPPGSVLNELIRRWLVLPANFATVGNVVTGLALLLLLLTVLAKAPTRWWLSGATIYSAIFAWETRLALEPAATRILIIGATLVVLMIARPQGLLGKAEVKVV
jgi:ABC-type branched-subunit amino acid transport system permease subunit